MAREARTIIFGGAFDPPTISHVAIFKKIQEYATRPVDEDYVIKVLISCNDEKVYKTSFEHRKAMTKIAFDKVKKVDYDIVMQEARMLDTIKDTLGIIPEDAIIVIGMDQAVNIANDKWRYSDELREKCRFLVFDRGFGKSRFDAIKDKFRRITKIEFDDYSVLGLSSSKARDLLERYPFTAYENSYRYYNPEIEITVLTDVLEYIAKNNLYNQYEMDKYKKEEDAFIEQYKKDAVTHGWHEPSCTATIVAYTSSEEVLLVRRKGFPFKGYWALPGGFFELSDKSLEDTAARELTEETSLDMTLNSANFNQIKVYSHMFDPRLRVIDTGFSVCIPEEMESMAAAADDAMELKWFPIFKLPPMAFHHAQIVGDFLRSENNPFKK